MSPLNYRGSIGATVVWNPPPLKNTLFLWARYWPPPGSAYFFLAAPQIYNQTYIVSCFPYIAPFPMFMSTRCREVSNYLPPLLSLPFHPSPPSLYLTSPFLSYWSPDPSFPPIPPACRKQGSCAPSSSQLGVFVPIRGTSSQFWLVCR